MDGTEIQNSIRPDGSLTEIRPKICKWCRKEFYPEKKKKDSLIFCDEDCRQEEYDWLYLTGYQKNKESSLIRYHKSKKLKGRKIRTQSIKEYKKEWYLKNQKKLQARAKQYRMKKKLSSVSIVSN